MNRKILIVEDEKDMLWAMEMRLSSLGYDVICAENGQKGIQIFNEYHPDVVLLDVMLPDTNGFELCRSIKESKDTDTKVIIYTGKISGVDSTKAREANADEFVVKTEDFAFILDSIKKFT